MELKHGDFIRVERTATYTKVYFLGYTEQGDLICVRHDKKFIIDKTDVANIVLLTKSPV